MKRVGIFLGKQQQVSERDTAFSQPAPLHVSSHVLYDNAAQQPRARTSNVIHISRTRERQG
jgi:hypothetical protein